MPEPHFRQRPWGYDRAQVDAFVERTARRLAEGRAEPTPDGAVAEALERVGRETTAVLQRAHEVAAEVTARAQREATELTERSQRAAADLEEVSHRQAEQRRHAAELEAAAIVREAEAQANALDAEIESLNHERQALLTDIERISQRLHALVSQSDDRSEQAEPASDDTVGTARAVAARPADLRGAKQRVRVVPARPDDPLEAGGEADATATDPAGSRHDEDQATTEMPAAVVARDDRGDRP